MISSQELELLGCEELARIEGEGQDALKLIKRNEILSVKGMVLPPMFSFNVLKLALLLHDSELEASGVTWQKIKKDLLKREDIFLRKCENIPIYQMSETRIEMLESIFQETYASFGDSIEKKAELYGNLVFRVCQWTLCMRCLMHASKYFKNED